MLQQDYNIPGLKLHFINISQSSNLTSFFPQRSVIVHHLVNIHSHVICSSEGEELEMMHLL